MGRAKRGAKGLAFILLILIAAYSAYFTARWKIGNEHVMLSRAAVLVPLSGPVGEAVICIYGRLWSVDCSGQEGTAALNLTIRYLCPVFEETRHYECIDRNMVGIAAILTILAAAIAAVAAARRSWRSPDRAPVAILHYGGAAVVSLLLLWHLAHIVRPTFWIGALDERMIAASPILAFTGNAIGYGLLIALAAIGIAGAGAAALALARR